LIDSIDNRSTNNYCSKFQGERGLRMSSEDGPSRFVSKVLAIIYRPKQDNLGKKEAGLVS